MTHVLVGDKEGDLIGQKTTQKHRTLLDLPGRTNPNNSKLFHKIKGRDDPKHFL